MSNKNNIKQYDVIVVGSGSGDTIVNNALRQGLTVAWVDRGPLGGTCLNVGCIPSKILIFPADRVMEIREAEKLGIKAEIGQIDFAAIMDRMRRMVNHSQQDIRKGLDQVRNLDFYEVEGYFIDENEHQESRPVLQVGDERITGDRIYLVSGARPLIPDVKGLDEIDYLTNETVLDLRERPESLVIIGGGYISAEYAHFFAAMGTRVTILQQNDHLVPDEEPEISELLKEKLSERMDVYVSTEVVEVREDEGTITVIGRDRYDDERIEVAAQRVMVAAGRKSNADLLKVENAGIETDEEGYIEVNEYLETNVENVWALGDATGGQMFKHVANREASLVWHNSVHDHKVSVNYRAVPHAVFSYPQIASVGLTEAEAEEDFDILVGRSKYLDVAKGQAMMETDAFAKSIVERGSGKILGFHIIGPYAPILIQEVVNVIAKDGTIDDVGRPMHIHPALPEVVVRALYNLREPQSRRSESRRRRDAV